MQKRGETCIFMRNMPDICNISRNKGVIRDILCIIFAYISQKGLIFIRV